MPPRGRRVIAIVPARGGSKGVPRKNIRPLAGRPLLAYSVDAARGAESVDVLVVSTEDAEIASVAKELGVETITRPPDLAGDDTPTLPVVQHVLDVVEAREGRFDYVLVLQPTSPLRTAADIDHAVQLLDESGAESVISIVRIQDAHPARVKKIVNGRLEAFCIPEEETSRRQDLEPAYLRNGAIYLCRRSVVEAGSLRGMDQCPYEMPAERSVNIDEPIDFVLCEALMRQHGGQTGPGLE